MLLLQIVKKYAVIESKVTLADKTKRTTLTRVFNSQPDVNVKRRGVKEIMEKSKIKLLYNLL